PCSVHFKSRASALFMSFFARHANHQDLYSFPTRRSSDLGTVCSAGRSRFVCRGPTRWPSVGSANQSKRSSVVGRPTTDDRLLWLDRKSTRLNSSHVAISYAVFCLKKKKTSTAMPADDNAA